jgi:hypothetical protein
MDLGKMTCNVRKTCFFAGLFVMISCKVVSHVVDIDLPTRHTFEHEVYGNERDTTSEERRDSYDRWINDRDCTDQDRENARDFLTRDII